MTSLWRTIRRGGVVAALATGVGVAGPPSGCAAGSTVPSGRDEEDDGEQAGGAGGREDGSGGRGGAGGQSGTGGAGGQTQAGAGGASAKGGAAGASSTGGTAGASSQGGSGAPDAGVDAGPANGGKPDPDYLKVQPIFTRSCALSGCHTNGPRCPSGVPINRAADSTDHLQCADPNEKGTLIGLDLTDARSIQKTAIGVDSYHSVLERTCGKWLRTVAPTLQGSKTKRIVPGDPKNSYVFMKLRRVTEAYLATQGRTLRDLDRGQDEDVTRCHGFLMPRSEALRENPKVELSGEEVELIRAWILRGARLTTP